MHAATPSVAHTDSLGRTFLTLAHNRFERSGAIVEENYATRVVLDIEGNQREVIDAKDRVVMRYDYDIAGPEEDENTGNSPVADQRSSMISTFRNSMGWLSDCNEMVPPLSIRFPPAAAISPFASASLSSSCDCSY